MLLPRTRRDRLFVGPRSTAPPSCRGRCALQPSCGAVPPHVCPAVRRAPGRTLEGTCDVGRDLELAGIVCGCASGGAHCACDGADGWMRVLLRAIVTVLSVSEAPACSTQECGRPIPNVRSGGRSKSRALKAWILTRLRAPTRAKTLTWGVQEAFPGKFSHSGTSSSPSPAPKAGSLVNPPGLQHQSSWETPVEPLGPSG